MTSRVALLALAAAVACAVTLPAAATSYVMVTDEALVERSAAAVEARVLSVEPAPLAGRPHTDYLIEVDRLLAGEVTGRNLVVRLPGGVRPDGVGLKLWGIPELAQGERVVLFLNPREDGTYGVTHLFLGAFREVVRSGRRVLVRDHLSEARELATPGEAPGSRERYGLPRAAAEFSRWVEARGRGDEPAADYFLEPEAADGGDPGRVTDPFTLFEGRDNNENPTGLNMRWFIFEEGSRAEWEMQSGGQPGYSQSATIEAFKSGMNAWNGDGGSNVDYRFKSAGPPSPGNSNDGRNWLVFDNFDGAVTDGDFTCTGSQAGGVLAIGGPYFNTRPIQDSRGIMFHRIIKAEITANKGIGCYLTTRVNPQRALEQLLAHELGHTLGIGHSCGSPSGCAPAQNDALMNAFFHDDNRGAVLNSDDRNAVRYLYPAAQQGDPPAAPSALAGTPLSTSQAQLSWTDNAGDETGFRLEGRLAGGAFALLANLPPNTTQRTVAGLDDDTLYEFRVRAFNQHGPSAFSNVAQVTTLLAPPAAPSGLVATPASSTSAALTWIDQSDNEADFVVEARNPQSGDDDWSEVKDGVVAEVPGSPTVTTVVDGLTTGLPYVFRVRARNAAGVSAPSNPDAATPPEDGSGGCDDGGGALCLLGDRFQVSAQWRRPNGTFGTGTGAVFPQSDRSGTFWFFNEQNIELIVKVLDGSNNNGHYWTFYGALSDVEYWITVVDTELGNSRTYYNPQGDQCGEFDTASLPAEEVPVEGGSLVALPLAAPAVTAAAGTCVEDDTTVCLLDGRFMVQVDWINQHAGGTTGVGHKAQEPEESDRTGYFWFFNQANVELVVKALDGRSVNGFYWFFYGSLSDVEYHVTVTDTTSSESRVYSNEPFDRCGQFDTTAFTPEGEVPLPQ